MSMISFPLPPAPFAETVLAELNVKIDDYNYTDASSWADIDPSTLRTDVLQLAQKPKPTRRKRNWKTRKSRCNRQSQRPAGHQPAGRLGL